MLSVLAYGSKVSQRHKQPDFGSIKVELALEKLQIQNLVQAKDEATQRFEQLSAAFQNLEAGLNASEPTSASPVPGNSMISMLSSIDPQTAVLAPATTSEIESTDIDTTSNCLKLCANAVRKLASSIDAATQRWEASRALEYVAIQSALNKTTKAVTLLQASRNHDLSDYERQLMLLDEQNKKRILMARQEQGEATRAERSAHPQSNQALPPTVRSQVPGSDISRPQSQQATSRFPIQPLRARQPRTFTQSLPQRVSHHRREFAGHSQDFDTFDFADLDLHDDLDSSGLVSLLPAQENAAGNFDFSGVELEYVPNTTGNANTSSTPDSETPEESILDEKDCDREYGGADDWEDDEVDVIDGLLRRWTKVAA
ncbi:uncharacterized protein MYCFIDRAFT_198360 [Pseudocercospora fijiensis CIRAD86]|uniref:Fungal N-terminal domain-containing protein n=1 Tax=Pseudocercospora fijiensis (strain CIRAD86) TaxID=383855 RepID=M3A5W6_PSEFD|nr:uncharacterized protein MYCFIDRAFT_198360 [Pseudocercospora fijiensis CIRAD86]EME80016.1 hypothetical protein MYCFIDRAFT_198360 [Pseudocercospora fijiensis CIRAD86]